MVFSQRIGILAFLVISGLLLIASSKYFQEANNMKEIVEEKTSIIDSLKIKLEKSEHEKEELHQTLIEREIELSRMKEQQALVSKTGTIRQSLPLEFFPNLVGPVPVELTHKSLVAIPVGNRSKPLIEKLITKFGFQNFSYVLFIYDYSDWSGFDWATKVIWISGFRQVKFWYLKRFITPDVAMAYEFIWVIDDDVDIEHIDPQEFSHVLRMNNVQIAQPAHLPGYKFSHPFTVRAPGTHVGRWSNFVEIGPLVVFSQNSYICAWDLFQIDMSAGWGLDLLWGDFCKFTKMAIIDRFPMIHVSTASIIEMATATKDNENYYERAFAEENTLFTRYPTLRRLAPGSMHSRGTF